MAIQLPAAARIDRRCLGEFQIAFDHPLSEGELTAVVGALYRARLSIEAPHPHSVVVASGELPDSTRTNPYAQTRASNRILVQLQEIFRPSLPFTAYVDVRRAYQGSDWADLIFCGAPSQEELEVLATRIKDELGLAGNVRIEKHERRINFRPVEFKTARREAWAAQFSEVGIAAVLRAH